MQFVPEKRETVDSTGDADDQTHNMTDYDDERDVRTRRHNVYDGEIYHIYHRMMVFVLENDGDLLLLHKTENDVDEDDPHHPHKTENDGMDDDGDDCHLPHMQENDYDDVDDDDDDCHLPHMQENDIFGGYELESAMESENA